MRRGDLGVGDAEPQLARPLVERGLGDELAEHLPVEAERARLVGRDRPAELAAELLQPVVVELAELLDARSRCCRPWRPSSGRSRGKCRRCPRSRS